MKNYSCFQNMNLQFEQIINVIPDPEEEYFCSPNTKSKGFTILHAWVLMTRKFPEVEDKRETRTFE